MRVKYLLGNIPILIEDKDKSAIKILVKKKYVQLHSLKGRGFVLTKEKQITCICSQSEYRNKIIELEKLLYEIEFKNLQIEEAVKDVSENTSSSSETVKKRNNESDKSKENDGDKKQ